MKRDQVAFAAFVILVISSALAAFVFLGPSEVSGPPVEPVEGLSPIVAASVRAATLPSELPLIGDPEARDEHGYPRSYVDQAALQALLRASRFSDLTRHVEEVQEAFEADWRNEVWPVDAMYAFRTPDPALTALMDAWVADAPRSFAPYLARCAHWNAIGLHRRGGRFVDETSEVELASMYEAFARARPDCERALELRPRLVAAHQRLLQMGRIGGDDELARRSLAAALRVCPACYGIRAIHVRYLAPRWGGSQREMEEFAREAARQAPENTRLRALAGYAHWDRCRSLSVDDHGGALSACDAAIVAGDDATFYSERANVHLARDQIELARADVDRALELAPQVVDVLLQRFRIEASEGRWVEASESLLTAARIDPAQPELPGYLESARRAARRSVVDAAREGDWPGAERALDRAADLGVEDAHVAQLRAHARAVLDASARVASHPDDLEAHRALDHALLPPGRLDLVIAMWTGYLQRHPRDGQAFLERGGAHFHLGQLAEAERDARRACDLGVTQGCAHAQRIAARAKSR